MSESPDLLIDKPFGAANASPEMSPSTGDATYQVRFSKFGSGSPARNSFNLARGGEIKISGDALIIHAFQREMWLFGSRIELAFARAHVTDVSQLGNFVSLRIVRPGQDLETLGFWTQNEGDAKNIVQSLPSTMSAAGIAVKEYEAQLKLLDRGDYVTKALVAANILVFGAAGLAGAGFLVPNAQVLQAWGTNVGPLTTDGQWWRLVTSMFLHFGVFHLALNMWALYVGGRLAERLFGAWAFALIYFSSGLGGSLSSLLWN